jgi:hypothetical protein
LEFRENMARGKKEPQNLLSILSVPVPADVSILGQAHHRTVQAQKEQAGVLGRTPRLVGSTGVTCNQQSVHPYEDDICGQNYAQSTVSKCKNRSSLNSSQNARLGPSPTKVEILTITLGPVAGAQLVVRAAVHVLTVLSASTATAVPKALTTTTALLAPASTLFVGILIISISVLPEFVLPGFLIIVNKFSDQVAEL